jgi:hypothetical protein
LTGSAVAKPMGSRLLRKLVSEREWLLARLAAKSGCDAARTGGELYERGIAVSYGSLWRLLDDEKIS